MLILTNTCRLNKNLSSLIGKKITCKKTPREDCELGNSDLTEALTFHLTPHQQKIRYCTLTHYKSNAQVSSWSKHVAYSTKDLSTCGWVRFHGTRRISNEATISSAHIYVHTISKDPLCTHMYKIRCFSSYLLHPPLRHFLVFKIRLS